ncbi:MAG: flavin reductase [Firmicutes bacterium]|nr:flavin reductase [Bacillota bacterium]
MGKTSIKPTNDYCPQTLFLYGTYDKDGKPDFALFCWFSYIWDGELGVMCCIGGEKQTKENIHRNKVFSANLVTEKMLCAADYLGNVSGFDPEKIKLDIGKGAVLPVPVVNDSPVIYELEVKQFIPLEDGEVMLCRIHNVLQDDLLISDDLSIEQKLLQIAPAMATHSRYFGYLGADLGAWGEPMKKVE